MDAKEAAKQAGYSERSAKQIGYELLQKEHVKAEVSRLKSERAVRVQVEVDYVLETILETINRCRQAKPVTDKQGAPVFVENAEGELVPAYVFDAKSVLKGCELVGKHLKMWTEKHEHSGPNGGPIPFEIPQSDEELDARIKALMEKGKGR